MEEKIKALKEQMEAALGSVESKEQLGEFWQNFLGKKGSIADLMKGLGSVPKEERPNVGKTINEFKNQVEARYQEMKNKMDELELAARNKSEQVDITMPAKMRPAGGLSSAHRHRERDDRCLRRNGLLRSMTVRRSRMMITTFTRLNVAKNHPARDMQDTFYVAEDIFTPHTYKSGTDPCHGCEEAADQDAGTGARIPFRQRRDPLPDVPSDGRSCCG